MDSTEQITRDLKKTLANYKKLSEDKVRILQELNEAQKNLNCYVGEIIKISFSDPAKLNFPLKSVVPEWKVRGWYQADPKWKELSCNVDNRAEAYELACHEVTACKMEMDFLLECLRLRK